MLMDMTEVERANLFPKKYPLPLTKGAYIRSVESWRKIQVEKWEAQSDQRHGYPIEAAKDLLEGYVECQEHLFKFYGTKGWQAKRLVWTLMNACLHRPLQNAIKFKDRLENAESLSELYPVALSIIQEYETYCSQKAKIDKHVEAQRKILDSRRKEFLIALEKREGLFCKACESVEKLRIDHDKPLSLGGFSVLENLQLLCSFCNGRKGDRPMDYLYRRMNKSRKPPIK